MRALFAAVLSASSSVCPGNRLMPASDHAFLLIGAVTMACVSMPVPKLRLPECVPPLGCESVAASASAMASSTHA